MAQAEGGRDGSKRPVRKGKGSLGMLPASEVFADNRFLVAGPAAKAKSAQIPQLRHELFLLTCLQQVQAGGSWLPSLLFSPTAVSAWLRAGRDDRSCRSPFSTRCPALTPTAAVAAPVQYAAYGSTRRGKVFSHPPSNVESATLDSAVGFEPGVSRLSCQLMLVKGLGGLIVRVPPAQWESVDQRRDTPRRKVDGNERAQFFSQANLTASRNLPRSGCQRHRGDRHDEAVAAAAGRARGVWLGAQ